MSDDMPQHVVAHAKLNLSLRVLARETSGYHQLETVFCGIDLADEIEISRTSAGITLEIAQPAETPGRPPDVGPAEQNLAYRAASLFARETSIEGGIHIRLVKRIPAGAGLGGGSSDAAAVLRALNARHAQPLTQHTLLGLGARLGSDVPYFLAEAPLALAWGRGERILPLPALPVAPVVLAVPSERVSTADAYAALDSARPPVPTIVKLPRTWHDAAVSAHNDFEDVVFARHPRLRALRQALADAGATLARLTGSGSVVFGVFEEGAAAGTAARELARSHADVAIIVTRSRAY
jgi:4-diphosphocytidyl-2-C-methyl-D-erythritol kinase